jgi:hypothetical protein
MMPNMRTTLTLEADVARLLEEQMHRTRRSFKDVVNEALRKGLGPQIPSRPKKRVRIVPHIAHLLPGLDRTDLNQLADEVETGVLMAKERERGE